VSVRIDLHTHSDRSDGTDHPRRLVANAAAAGVDVLAITDHDTVAGWASAAATAAGLGIGLVPGLEISCAHQGTGVHLLAYLPDPNHPPLQRELQRIRDGRLARLPATVERLGRLGIDITLSDVRAAAGPADATGRPHVADVLVQKGVVGSRGEAFDRYLANGRPAYVHRYAADLTGMLGMVAAAGGVTVLAHPWGRRSRRVVTPAVIAELCGHGLTGVEVDHQDHDDTARKQLRALCGELGLVATGSSDYHGAGKPDNSLGCNVTAPEQFDRLLHAAHAAAARAGRGTEPVLP
jgi:predicted metal-dependent phosphoesterase TrpH